MLVHVPIVSSDGILDIVSLFFLIQLGLTRGVLRPGLLEVLLLCRAFHCGVAQRGILMGSGRTDAKRGGMDGLVGVILSRGCIGVL